MSLSSSKLVRTALPRQEESIRFGVVNEPGGIPSGSLEDLSELGNNRWKILSGSVTQRLVNRTGGGPLEFTTTPAGGEVLFQAFNGHGYRLLYGQPVICHLYKIGGEQAWLARPWFDGCPPHLVASIADRPMYYRWGGGEGTLATRTSDTSGIIVMDSADHQIATAATITIESEAMAGSISGALVGTVAGTSIPFTGALSPGGGVVLPAQGQRVTLSQNPLEQRLVFTELEGWFAKYLELDESGIIWIKDAGPERIEGPVYFTGEVVIERSSIEMTSGTLTTRESDSKGILTLGPDHGFEFLQAVDIYWMSGPIKEHRSASVTDVGSETIDVDYGSGSPLPGEGSQVEICLMSQRRLLIRFWGESSGQSYWLGQLYFPPSYDPRAFPGYSQQFSTQWASGAAWSPWYLYRDTQDYPGRFPHSRIFAAYIDPAWNCTITFRNWKMIWYPTMIWPYDP